MGRGNVCTHNEYEGLYYLNKDLLSSFRKIIRFARAWGHAYDAEPKTARELINEGIPYSYDVTTDWLYDESISNDNWQAMVTYMCEQITKKYPSFKSAEKQGRNGSGRIVLESAFFQIAVIDNEWSVAWCLLERDDISGTAGNRALMRRNYKSYLEAIKNALIDGWGEAIAYGGAWTHGDVIKRTEDELCS
jgi:hypothetical protein